MSKAKLYRCARMAKYSQQEGFALPLALVAIALLSIITLAGYRAVSAATAVTLAFQENMQTELAFFSAEAESAFVFLTSPPITDGILTANSQSVEGYDALDLALGIVDIDTELLQAVEYWRADGQVRISETQSIPVKVTYHDAAGFAPIALLPEEKVAAMFAAAGFDSESALRFAARIGDFQDADSRRRFRGAEATDYRLYGASAPTNSPLRVSGEMASVLGFADMATIESWDFFVTNVQYGGVISQFKPHFGPTAIATLFDDSVDEVIVTGLLDGYIDDSRHPSGTARFLLTFRLQSGMTRKRAMEIMRTAVAPDRPFRRIWLYDKAEDEQSDATPGIEQSDLAPVFQASTSPDSR